MMMMMRSSSLGVDHDVLAAPDAGVQEPRPGPGNLLGPGPHVADVVKLGPGQRLVNHPLGDPALRAENMMRRVNSISRRIRRKDTQALAQILSFSIRSIRAKY